MDSYMSNIEEYNDNIEMNEKDDNECNDIDKEQIEVFNKALEQYLNVVDEIKILTEAIKKRNEIKKNLSETLINFLELNNIKNINLYGSYTGKKIENYTTTTITGFTKSNVTEAIYNELKDNNEVFDKIMRAISNNSIHKQTTKIKITNDKKIKNNIINNAVTLLND